MVKDEKYFYEKLNLDIIDILDKSKKIAESIEEDGAYNYDSCLIKIPDDVPFEIIDKSLIENNFSFMEDFEFGFQIRKNILILKTPSGFNQNKRTAFAEASCALLLSKGYNAEVLYYLD